METKSINLTMDNHAITFGLSHWKCIDPKGNEYWQRSDGLRVQYSFSSKGTYIDDLRSADKLIPIGTAIKGVMIIFDIDNIHKPLIVDSL